MTPFSKLFKIKSEMNSGMNSDRRENRTVENAVNANSTTETNSTEIFTVTDNPENYTESSDFWEHFWLYGLTAILALLLLGMILCLLRIFMIKRGKFVTLFHTC